MIKRTLFGRGLLLAAALMMVAPAAKAGEATTGSVTIMNPTARANLPNRPTAAYMMILNEGTEADRLIAARSPAFGTIELHTSSMKDGVMRMKKVDGIEVPADGTALLAPGGFHLMLFEAERPFKVGESYMMTLTFEKAGDVMVEVKVGKISGGHNQSNHGSHSGQSGHSGHSGSTN